jgi:hypothetical protein
MSVVGKIVGMGETVGCGVISLFVENFSSPGFGTIILTLPSPSF